MTTLAATASWTEQAACRDYHPELWWLTDAFSQEAAKRICRGCPVRAQCLAWALDTGQNDGTLGGYTDKERRLLKRRQKKAAS